MVRRMRPADDAPVPPRPGTVRAWWRRIDPYWPVAAVLLAIAVLVAIQHPWSADLGMHVATINSLRANVTHPGSPLVDAAIASPYYSPYTLALAGFGGLTGLSTVLVLALVGPVNIAVLLVGLRAFVRTLTPRPAAPVLVLLLMLVLWGVRPLVWSGFFGLWSLPLVMSYPSTAALALTLLFWAGLSRTLDRRPASLARYLDLARYLGLSLLAAVIALTHQFTFVTTALGAIGLVAVRARSLDRATVLRLGAATAGLVGLLLAWPYYPYFALFGVTGLDGVHRVLYSQSVPYYGLVVVALPALWVRWRRSRLDPLVLLFLGGLVVVGAGWLTGHYALGRTWPAVILASQIALGVELPALASPAPASPGLVRRAGVAVVALTCLVGFAVQAGHLIHALPPALRPAALERLRHPWPDYAWISAYVHPGDVIVAWDYAATRSVVAYGAKTIAPTWPDPFLPDESRRRADLAEVYAPDTAPARRLELLARYHVRWILVVGKRSVLEYGRSALAYGPLGQRLYQVPGR